MEGCMSFVRKHKRIVILLVLVLVAGAGWFFWKSKQVKQTGYAVTRQNLREVMSFSGTIDAGVKANLRFQSAGKLTWVGVKEGDSVKKFQGIASLDRVQLKKSMEKYLNSYDKERNAFEQDQADNKDYAVSGLSSVQKETIKRTLQNAQADLNNSVLDFEIQNMAYRDAYLFTPIAGLVTRVNVPQVGINILASQAEFEVVDPGSGFSGGGGGAGMVGGVKFDEKDVTDLKRVAGIEYVVPVFMKTGSIESVDKQKISSMMGTNEEFFKLMDAEPLVGEVFGKTEVTNKSKVAVLGNSVAGNLYSEAADGVGKTIRVKLFGGYISGCRREKT